MAGLVMQGTRIERVADAVGLAAVAQLFRTYQQELGVDLCFQGFDAELAGLPGPYAEPTGCLLLAYQGATAVGVVALKPLEPPDVAEMKRLYVAPDARGAGLAAGLVEMLEAEARRRGYRRRKLDTLARLVGASRLYGRRGYQPTDPYTHNPEPDIRYFEKRL